MRKTAWKSGITRVIHVVIFRKYMQDVRTFGEHLPTGATIRGAASHNKKHELNII
jgi:hypothetical protein